MAARRAAAQFTVNSAPWERLDGESAPAFEAWVAYRDGQPDASLNTVAKQLGKDRSLMGQWSRRWRWQERLRAWEVEQDRQRQAAHLDKVRRRTDRHASSAELAIEALVRPSAEIIRRLTKDQHLLEGMPLWDLYRLSVQANKALPQLIKAERLALGLSTEAVDQRDARRAQGQAEARAATDTDLDRELLGLDARPDDLDQELADLTEANR